MLRKAFARGLILAATAISIASPVSAQTYVEDFEDPFASWETDWFGTNSNANNYYVVVSGSPITERGNNPDGLWIHDGNSATSDARIVFDPVFGAGLTSLYLDVASHISGTITIFDLTGATLFSSALTVNYGTGFDPGTYANYGTTSTTGIGGFILAGSNGATAEGNIGIDNVIANGNFAPSVPEPATWAMMLMGFGAAGYSMRRRRKAVMQFA